MSAATLFPPLKWAQRQDVILLTADLQDARNVQLQLPMNGAVLSLTCDMPTEGGDVSHYACTLSLFRSVTPEESNFVVRPRQIEIKLKKKDAKDDDEAFWPRLTKEKDKNKNITIDWARWRDEDDDLDADVGGLDDFGMGGFGGLGGSGEADDEFTQKMMQQFAVQQGRACAEGLDGGAIPEFGSAQGQPLMDPVIEGDDDEEMPPLEEDS